MSLIKFGFVSQLLAFLLTDISIAVFAWYLFYAAYYKIRKFKAYLLYSKETTNSFFIDIAMIPVDNSAIVTSVWLVNLK